MAVVVSTVVMNAGIANAAVTSLTSETFTGSSTTSNAWVRPSAGANVACLTAGTNTAQTPIPDCSTSAIDTAGNGSLRLTGNGGSLVGTVYNTTSLPTAQGFDVKFNTYQWNGSGADGISFVLAATDPTNPAPPANAGPNGGSLGYSATGSTAAGVSDGYLGFGLDVFGNFEASAFGGTNCPASSAAPGSITVRGPGNAHTGYCVLGTTTASGQLDAPAATSRPTAVPVEIVVNPGPATTSGVIVAAQSWLIRVTPIGGAPQTLTGLLPTAATLNANNFPAGWYDPATGVPYQLTFGWAASTGGSNEIHEINSLTTTTLNGQLPSYDLGIADNESSTFLAGNQAIVSVTPSLDASQGDESQPSTVTTTFPTGITPGAFTEPTGYLCTTVAQVVTCTYTPTGPLAAGTALPTLNIPVTVATSAASGTITSKVSSNDGNPSTASHAVAVTTFAASPSAASTHYGTADTLSATGIPSAATGSIAFASGGTALCTATLPATSCTTSTSLAVANYPVTATYSGDADYATQTATTSFSVSLATTALVAGASPASVPYGTVDALSGTGLPSDATGTITFTSGASTLCTVTLPATSCDSPISLAPASYPVTATYSGDSNYATSTDTTSFSVTQAATTLVAAVSSPSVAYGTADTLSVSGLPSDASGTVTFTSGATTLCTATLPSTSCASSTSLGVATYPISATYSGDSNYAGTSGTSTFDVTKASTGLTAGISAASVPYGTVETLSESGLPSGANGTVTFTSGGSTLCIATLPATSCATSATLEPSSYPVTATYSGDANHTGTSDTTAFAVAKDVVTISASPSSPSVVYGTADTLSATGLPGTAMGTVTFATGGTTLCIATLPATSCVTPTALGAGTYPVTATYSGDAHNATAQAATTFGVTPAGTTISASVSDASIAYGTPNTLSVSGLPGGIGGTVAFTAGGVTLCTATLPATTCTTPSALKTGAYAVTATYSGDPNHTGSSAMTSFTVTPADVTITAAVSAPSVSYGAPDQTSVSGLPIGATGTVTFVSGDVTMCTVTLPATSCSTPAGLAVGSYPITATYSGDADHASATATTSFTVVPAATISATVASGGAKTIAIPGAAGARSVTITGAPAHGTAQIVRGAVLYTADAGFAGTDSTTVRVVQPDGSVSVVTVTIHVQGLALTASPTSSDASSSLPFTGAAVIAPTVVAAILLASGTLIVWMTKRSRRTSG